MVLRSLPIVATPYVKEPFHESDAYLFNALNVGLFCGNIGIFAKILGSFAQGFFAEMCFYKSGLCMLNTSNTESIILQLRVTGWRRLVGCLKLQIIFGKRATNYRALLRKITYKDKAFYYYDSMPPCRSEGPEFPQNRPIYVEYRGMRYRNGWLSLRLAPKRRVL